MSHPLFKNVSQATAAEQLAREEPGACVFRPSVRGPVALGLTIKLHDGPDGQPLFYHTDLDESGKVREFTLQLWPCFTSQLSWDCVVFTWLLPVLHVVRLTCEASEA